MRRQAGVAIITVLLMIALATIAAVSMAKRQYLDVRRTGAREMLAQASQALLAAEDLAIMALRLDDAKMDSPDEDWTRTVSAPVAGGLITGCLFDLQGRFNLNNLVDKENRPIQDEVDRFELLLNALGVESNLIPKIIASTIDWIDKDINPYSPDGAEDDYYMNQTNEGALAYRAANRPFLSVSELRMVNGVNELDGETYTQLERNVSALPEQTGFNVNTATVEGLRMLAAHIDQEKAEEILRWPEDRVPKYPACGDIILDDTDVGAGEVPAPFDTMDTLKNAVKEGNNVLQNETGIVFASEYFQLRTDVALGSVQLTQFSLLHRSAEGKVQVLSRARGEY